MNGREEVKILGIIAKYLLIFFVRELPEVDIPYPQIVCYERI